MRCFVAVNIDEKMKSKIKDMQALIKGDIIYVKPENLHLTLKFLGEISEEKVEIVKNVIESVCINFRSFDINFKGVGCFPNKNYARVLWVGAESGCEIFSELAKTLDTEFEKIGFVKEAGYAPHLTIARIRSANHNINAVLEKFENTEFGTLKFGEILLFKSTLTGSGHVYEKIYSVKLV